MDSPFLSYGVVLVGSTGSFRRGGIDVYWLGQIKVDRNDTRINCSPISKVEGKQGATEEFCDQDPSIHQAKCSVGTASLCENLLTPSTESVKGGWKKKNRWKSLVDVEPGTVQVRVRCHQFCPLAIRVCSRVSCKVPGSALALKGLA